MRDFVPTKHLIEKMQSRNVTWAEVVDVLEHPEVSFGPDFQGRKTVQKGDLAVVVSRDGAVITVLLKDADQWTDEDARNRVVRAAKYAEEHLNTLKNVAGL